MVSGKLDKFLKANEDLAKLRNEFIEASKHDMWARRLYGWAMIVRIFGVTLTAIVMFMVTSRTVQIGSVCTIWAMLMALDSATNYLRLAAWNRLTTINEKMVKGFSDTSQLGMGATIEVIELHRKATTPPTITKPRDNSLN